MSIKIKTVTFIMIITLIVTLAVIVFDSFRYSQYINTNIDNNLNNAVQNMNNEIRAMESMARVAALYFANDPEIIRMSELNRDTLTRHAAMLRAEAGVDFLIITDNNGRTLTGQITPEVFEDNLSSLFSVQSALKGESVTVIERGESAKMLVSSGIPVYNRGRLLGAIIAGYRLDSEGFADRLKNITGCEAAIFIGNECVASTLLSDHEAGMADTSRLIQADNNKSHRINFYGHNLAVKSIALKDANGHTAGILMAGSLMASQAGSLLPFIIMEIVIALIFMGLSIPFILIAVKHITASVEKSLEEVHRDELTGIFNRRYVDENLKYLIRFMSRFGGDLSVLLIDIDFFNEYNDTYGHARGDNCLKTVANALAKCVSRAEDLVARYGDKEFILVLPNTDGNGAHVICQRLLSIIKECKIPHEKNSTGYVTISIGTTTGKVNFSQKGEDYISRAAELMNKSRESGHNKGTFGEMPQKPVQ